MATTSHGEVADLGLPNLTLELGHLLSGRPGEGTMREVLRRKNKTEPGSAVEWVETECSDKFNI